MLVISSIYLDIDENKFVGFFNENFIFNLY